MTLLLGCSLRHFLEGAGGQAGGGPGQCLWVSGAQGSEGPANKVLGGVCGGGQVCGTDVSVPGGAHRAAQSTLGRELMNGRELLWLGRW